MSDWATNLASAINTKTANNELLLGVVTSIKPLAIKTKNVVITRNIFVNPALTFMQEAQLKQIFTDPLPEPQNIFNVLKSFVLSYIVKQGDTVVLSQEDTSFYIIAKVAKQS